MARQSSLHQGPGRRASGPPSGPGPRQGDVIRHCFLLGLPKAGRRAEYVRHVAVGRRTLCNVELGGSIPDPPDFDLAGARLCGHCRPRVVE